MSWLLLLAINVVAISVASLFQRLAMKEEESDPVLSTTIFQFLLGLVVLPFAISQGFSFPPLATMWPLFLMSTTLYAFGSVLFFKSIKLIEASEMTVLAGAGAIVTMICAYIFLGERLVPQQYLGAAFVLVAILIIAHRGHKLVFNKGALLALLATSFFSFANISDVMIIKNYDAISYAGMMSLLPGLMLLFLYPKKMLQLPKAIKNINKNLIIYSFIYSIGVITFYGALGKGAMLSQVGVVIKTNIILTVILAAIFIKENDHLWRKVTAALICMIGVMLVA
jgi:transporter family protein